MLDVRYVFPVDGSRVVAPRDCKAILEQLRLEIALEVVIVGVAATPYREPEQQTTKGSLNETCYDAIYGECASDYWPRESARACSPFAGSDDCTGAARRVDAW